MPDNAADPYSISQEEVVIDCLDLYYAALQACNNKEFKEAAKLYKEIIDIFEIRPIYPGAAAGVTDGEALGAAAVDVHQANLQYDSLFIVETDDATFNDPAESSYQSSSNRLHVYRQLLLLRSLAVLNYFVLVSTYSAVERLSRDVHDAVQYIYKYVEFLGDMCAHRLRQHQRQQLLPYIDLSPFHTLIFAPSGDSSNSSCSSDAGTSSSSSSGIGTNANVRAAAVKESLGTEKVETEMQPPSPQRRRPYGHEALLFYCLHQMCKDPRARFCSCKQHHQRRPDQASASVSDSDSDSALTGSSSAAAGAAAGAGGSGKDDRPTIEAEAAKPGGHTGLAVMYQPNLLMVLRTTVEHTDKSSISFLPAAVTLPEFAFLLGLFLLNISELLCKCLLYSESSSVIRDYAIGKSRGGSVCVHTPGTAGTAAGGKISVVTGSTQQQQQAQSIPTIVRGGPMPAPVVLVNNFYNTFHRMCDVLLLTLAPIMTKFQTELVHTMMTEGRYESPEAEGWEEKEQEVVYTVEEYNSGEKRNSNARETLTVDPTVYCSELVHQRQCMFQVMVLIRLTALPLVPAQVQRSNGSSCDNNNNSSNNKTGAGASDDAGGGAHDNSNAYIPAVAMTACVRTIHSVLKLLKRHADALSPFNRPLSGSGSGSGSLFSHGKATITITAAADRLLMCTYPLYVLMAETFTATPLPIDNKSDSSDSDNSDIEDEAGENNYRGNSRSISSSNRRRRRRSKYVLFSSPPQRPRPIDTAATTTTTAAAAAAAAAVRKSLSGTISAASSRFMTVRPYQQQQQQSISDSGRSGRNEVSNLGGTKLQGIKDDEDNDAVCTALQYHRDVIRRARRCIAQITRITTSSNSSADSNSNNHVPQQQEQQQELRSCLYPYSPVLVVQKCKQQAAALEEKEKAAARATDMTGKKEQGREKERERDSINRIRHPLHVYCPHGCYCPCHSCHSCGTDSSSLLHPSPLSTLDGGAANIRGICGDSNASYSSNTRGISVLQCHKDIIQSYYMIGLVTTSWSGATDAFSMALTAVRDYEQVLLVQAFMWGKEKENPLHRRERYVTTLQVQQLDILYHLAEGEQRLGRLGLAETHIRDCIRLLTAVSKYNAKIQQSNGGGGGGGDHKTGERLQIESRFAAVFSLCVSVYVSVDKFDSAMAAVSELESLYAEASSQSLQYQHYQPQQQQQQPLGPVSFTTTTAVAATAATITAAEMNQQIRQLKEQILGRQRQQQDQRQGHQPKPKPKPVPNPNPNPVSVSVPCTVPPATVAPTAAATAKKTAAATEDTIKDTAVDPPVKIINAPTVATHVVAVAAAEAVHKTEQAQENQNAQDQVPHIQNKPLRWQRRRRDRNLDVAYLVLATAAITLGLAILVFYFRGSVEEEEDYM